MVVTKKIYTSSICLEFFTGRRLVTTVAAGGPDVIPISTYILFTFARAQFSTVSALTPSVTLSRCSKSCTRSSSTGFSLAVLSPSLLILLRQEQSLTSLVSRHTALPVSSFPPLSQRSYVIVTSTSLAPSAVLVITLVSHSFDPAPHLTCYLSATAPVAAHHRGQERSCCCDTWRETCPFYARIGICLQPDQMTTPSQTTSTYRAPHAGPS